MNGQQETATTTSLRGSVRKEFIVAKKRVFVSFDFDNDRTLKEFIIGQSKLEDSPFEVIDTSLKEAAPENTWLDKARVAITRSDIFLVMLSSKTRTALAFSKRSRSRAN